MTNEELVERLQNEMPRIFYKEDLTLFLVAAGMQGDRDCLVKHLEEYIRGKERMATFCEKHGTPEGHHSPEKLRRHAKLARNILEGKKDWLVV